MHVTFRERNSWNFNSKLINLGNLKVHVSRSQLACEWKLPIGCWILHINVIFCRVPREKRFVSPGSNKKNIIDFLCQRKQVEFY